MGFRRVAIALCFLLGSAHAQQPGQLPANRQPIGQPIGQPVARPPQAAVAVAPRAQRSIPSYFEELIRLEVALLTEAELAHASGCEMNLSAFQPQGKSVEVDAEVQVQGGPNGRRVEAEVQVEVQGNQNAKGPQLTQWDVDVYRNLLVDKMHAPETMLRSQFNQLKASSLLVFNLVSRGIGGTVLTQEMTKLNNAYYNMMSAIRFYVKWITPGFNTVANMEIYRNNMVRYANGVQSSIVFLRGVGNLNEADAVYADAGIAPIQNAAAPEPFPVYIPKQIVNQETKRTESSFLEGEVIAPNPNALK